MRVSYTRSMFQMGALHSVSSGILNWLEMKYSWWSQHFVLVGGGHFETDSVFEWHTWFGIGNAGTELKWDHGTRLLKVSLLKALNSMAFRNLCMVVRLRHIQSLSFLRLNCQYYVWRINYHWKCGQSHTAKSQDLKRENCKLVWHRYMSYHSSLIHKHGCCLDCRMFVSNLAKCKIAGSALRWSSAYTHDCRDSQQAIIPSIFFIWAGLMYSLSLFNIWCRGG